MRMPARTGRWELVAVGCLLALGAALRFWRLDLGWFGVDQARDIQTALDVAAGRDWPTVGPTMRRVTSLGALYYYVWALPYLVSSDPLAAYRFAAALGTATLVGVWALARRAWGHVAALVALAVLATAPVAVIDARIAWAPAALPAVAVALLWLLAGPPTTVRLAVLGAALGVAVQLHLAMAAWVLAAVIVVLVRRPRRPALVAGTVAGLVTGAPALYAALTNAGRDAGLATLPTRGPMPDVVRRLVAAWSLEWRVPSAFGPGPDPVGVVAIVGRYSAILIAVVALLGIGRLVLAIGRRDRLAVALVSVLVFQLAMVALLPGEAWYYYLDAALPVWALAAGALFATVESPGRPRAEARGIGAAVAAGVIVAALWLGMRDAGWLAAVARAGYVELDPAPLTLDGGGGRDAATPGRLVTVGVKRAVAAVLAREPAAFDIRWLSVHGPAFDDVTGDNGFWLARTATEAGAPEHHTAVWYRDDPTAPTVATAGVGLVDVGPLRLARYVPVIAYATCHNEGGPLAIPMRIVPAPRRYGDGTIARRRSLPRRVDCALRSGRGGTRVVATVTSGSVTVRDVTGAAGPTGSTSALCVVRGEGYAPFSVDIEVPAGATSDLDVYEQPDPECAAKIAP